MSSGTIPLILALDEELPQTRVNTAPQSQRTVIFPDPESLRKSEPSTTSPTAHDSESNRAAWQDRLALERTFLAYVRTSLTIAAVGVGQLFQQISHRFYLN